MSMKEKFSKLCENREINSHTVCLQTCKSVAYLNLISILKINHQLSQALHWLLHLPRPTT